VHDAPGGHGVQLALPEAAAKKPVAHAVHEVCWPALKVPAKHVVCVVAVHEAPGGHAVQLAAPSVLLKKPAGHATHAEPDCEKPAWQR
jgi:hypothetical protein